MYSPIFNALLPILQTLGKVGRVQKVYPDGDIKVDTQGSLWTYNPRCLTKVEGDGVPLTPSTTCESQHHHTGTALEL